MLLFPSQDLLHNEDGWDHEDYSSGETPSRSVLVQTQSDNFSVTISENISFYLELFYRSLSRNATVLVRGTFLHIELNSFFKFSSKSGKQSNKRSNAHINLGELIQSELIVD